MKPEERRTSTLGTIHGYTPASTKRKSCQKYLVLAHAEDVAIELFQRKVIRRHGQLALALNVSPSASPVAGATGDAAGTASLSPTLSNNAHLYVSDKTFTRSINSGLREALFYRENQSWGRFSG